MITAIIIFLLSTVISFILAAVTTQLIRKRDKLSQDEPFELTEINLSTPTPTPTPTPVYEKKKRGRKPKTAK